MTTGFKFSDYSPDALAGAIGEALACVAIPRCLDGAHAARDGEGFFLGGVGGRVPEAVRRSLHLRRPFLHHKY